MITVKQMKEFPEFLTPENKDKFAILRQNRIRSYMRKEIFELILAGDENNYFECDNFAKRFDITHEEMHKMRETIISELKILGWNLKTSFGDTGLFIYSTENCPKSCYEDGF